MSVKKSPKVSVSDQTEIRRGRWVVIRLASKRNAQELTFKQAEGLAKRLMRIVNLEKVRKVMEA